MKEANEQLGKLEEELETIDKLSFRMAFSVHTDPGLRSQLAKEAGLLKRRLLAIADEIKQQDPAVHKQWFHRISESFLDIDFVVTGTDITSLRLGDIVKWGK